MGQTGCRFFVLFMGGGGGLGGSGRGRVVLVLAEYMPVFLLSII